MIGWLGKSMAGHDLGKTYVIIKEEAEYVYLCDGQFKTLEHPKKKSKKHISLIKKYIVEETQQKIKSGNYVSDVEVKRVLKLYCKA